MRSIAPLLALMAVLLPSCVPPPRELQGRMERVSERGPVPGVAQGVTLFASAEPRGPRGLAVLVTLANNGERALRLELEHFTLSPDGELAATQAAPGGLQMPLPPNGGLRAEAFPTGRLAAGETARGYLYFPRRPGGPAELRARLVDAANGAVIDVISVDLPEP